MNVPDGLQAGIGVFCYLLGCVCTGYYLVRWRTGKDIRDSGSGAAGATNVGRVLGAPGFLITLLGDAAKGAAAVGGALAVGSREAGAVAMLAVTCGHIWPVQLGWRGGRGVGPALGSLLVFDALLALVLLGTFLVAMAVLKARVASGLLAIALAPLAAWLMQRPFSHLLAIGLLTLLLLLAHGRKLRRGELLVQAGPAEEKIGTGAG